MKIEWAINVMRNIIFDVLHRLYQTVFPFEIWVVMIIRWAWNIWAWAVYFGCSYRLKCVFAFFEAVFFGNTCCSSTSFVKVSSNGQAIDNSFASCCTFMTALSIVSKIATLILSVYNTSEFGDIILLVKRMGKAN